MDREYYLGLDIGTDSVGYAVTDESYKLLKFNGEPMWGSHVFDAASLKDTRRLARGARRRLDRRQQRVLLIQELFAKEIAKVDQNFFIRIKESSLLKEDASTDKGLFIDADFTDKEYHKLYPTIHHLIYELISNPEPHDVRLVCIACCWLVAHRGHFLSEVSKENVAEITNFDSVYNEFISYFDEGNALWNNVSSEGLLDILRKEISITSKKSMLINYLFSSKEEMNNNALEYEYDKESIIDFIVGKKTNMAKLFSVDDYSEFSLSAKDDDESINKVLVSIDEVHARLIQLMKNLYDCVLLTKLLKGQKYISHSKVIIYEKHKEDLKTLKYFVKKYAADQYDRVFRVSLDAEDNYVKYAKNAKSLDNKKLVSNKPINQEDFCKYIKNIVNAMQVNEDDNDKYEEMKTAIELCTFIPKQVSGENRVVPYQLYWIELKKLIENAASYLPFLNEVDQDGYVTKEKIMDVFEFKIPYYVGPLTSKAYSENAWMIRKAEGKIYPWNFKSKVDEEASEIEFINRMTNVCTYLPGKSVLPKNSLLYESFMVLNEINKLSINGKQIDVKTKQDIFNDVFKKYSKVTIKRISEYLLTSNRLFKGDNVFIGEKGEDITTALPMHKAYNQILQSGVLSEEEVERIINQATYTESKNRLEAWLQKNFSQLEQSQIKKIASLPCNGFGRLSREFLTQLEGQNNQTGEMNTIIGFLWNTNYNLMELLSDSFSFVELIETEKRNYYLKNPKDLNHLMDDMYISNAVKRPIIRALDIVNDVVKANKSNPSKIFVEMARGADKNNNKDKQKSRYEKIIELYKKVSDVDVRELEKELNSTENINNKLQSDKLFLYYMQLGKSMYSNRSINIENLNDGTVNIEHIYPQSKVKDDSVLNNEVLVFSKENGDKNDTYPINEKIRGEMKEWWVHLKNNDLITQEKFNRLTRSTPFSADEEWGFINRQLVEDRQSTKAVATILKQKYPKTEIVYVKAGLVSEFRNQYDMLKSRIVNDLHHAKDAYLNIVVGNVWHEKFTREWFIKNSNDYSINYNNIFGKYDSESGTITDKKQIVKNKVVWNGVASMELVKKNMSKNNVHYTQYAYCRNGQLFDINPLKAKEGLLELKKGKDPAKYGGYSGTTVNHFMLVKFEIKNKVNLMILSIENNKMHDFYNKDKLNLEYVQKDIESVLGKQIENVSLPLGERKLKIKTMIEVDGFRMVISSKGSKKVIGFSPMMPLVLSKETERYIKAIESFLNKLSKNSRLVYSEKFDIINAKENLDLYDELTSKYKHSVYSLRPEFTYKKLEEERKKFIELSIPDQAKILVQIITICGRNKTADTKLKIGRGDCRKSSLLSNWVKDYKSIIIVDESSTGLFSKKTDIGELFNK